MQDVIIKLNDKEFTAHCQSDCHESIHINGKPFEVDLLKKYHDNIFSFSVNQRIYQVELDFDGPAKLDITLDGFTYEVDITNSTRKLLEKYLKDSGMLSGTGAGIVKAPMPGLVVKVFVEPGMEVMPGDKLVVVEAMKMENVLKSTVQGTVKAITAKEGSAVDKDAVLVEIEVK